MVRDPPPQTLVDKPPVPPSDDVVMDKEEKV
jgi:hypothetical protein